MQDLKLEELLSKAIENRSDEAEMLLWMHLICTYQIRLKNDGASGTEGCITVSPVTQRGASQILAALWANPDDGEKTLCEHWYREYALKLGGESQISKAQADEVQVLRGRLESNAQVVAVELES